MSREPGDQPTRRTVAELLEQHGAKPASSPRRHRRRAAQDDGEDELTTTAPQAIIDRINSEHADGASAPTRRNGSHSHAAPDEPPVPPRAPQPPPPVRPAPQQPQQPPPAPQPPASGYNRAVPPPSSPSWPAPQQPPQPPQPAQPEPPQPPQQQPTQQQQSLGARLEGFAASRQRPPVEDSTEQMPAVDVPAEEYYDDDYEDDYQGGYPGYQQYQQYQDDYEYDEDYQGYAPSYPGGVEQGDPYGFAEDYEDDYPATAAEPVGAEEPAATGKEWLAVAAQLTMGVVGGAAVWLLFNWLWMQIPALALAAALIVVVGLVWIVRKIRKAEDMQTTVLAVLVGVVVTVSPAALLLLDK